MSTLMLLGTGSWVAIIVAVICFVLAIVLKSMKKI